MQRGAVLKPGPPRGPGWRGRLVAQALAGAWRAEPPPPALGDVAWEMAAPLLLGTGAGGLGWRRIRGSGARRTPAAFRFRQAYRLQTILAALHERQLCHILHALRSAGVECLVIKGWAVSRLYPEPGLRPYGDHDLCVRPDQHAAAVAALRPLQEGGCPVDIHRGIALLEDRRAGEIWRRTRMVPMGDTEARVLGPEDALRHLCWHLLDHGAWRPLWLCDIAAALESRPAAFDWDYFLEGSRRRSEGVVCALALAACLLGARLEDTPLAGRAPALPRWLAPEILRQWGAAYQHREPLVHHLRTRSGVLESLRRSWPDAIKATVGVRAPFNELPRWPFQLAQCAKRAAQIAVELARPAPG